MNLTYTTFKKAISYIGSMSFAIIILCLLALMSIIGTVIAQNRTTDFYRVSYGDRWQGLLQSLDIYDMYHSWWYLLLLGFLLLSMCLAVWRHAPHIWRGFKKLDEIPDIPDRQHTRLTVTQLIDPRGQQSKSSVAKVLKEAGFKDWLEKDLGNNEVLAFGRKGRLGKLSFLGVHIGLIIILVGGVASTQLGYRATINIPEGQSLNQAYIPNGDDFDTIELPFDIRNDSFFIDFYKMGKPSSFQTDLTVEKDGKTIAQKRIAVNDPLEVEGMTIYQASFGDAGSPVSFTFIDLTHPDFPLQEVDSNVHKILSNDDGNQITISELREHTVINLSENALQQKMHDVGPSIDIKMQTPTAGTIVYRSYLHYPHIISLKKLGEDTMKTEELGISLKDNGMINLLSVYMKHLYAGEKTSNFSPSDRHQAFASTLQELNIPVEKAREMGPKIAKTAEVLTRNQLPALFAFTQYESLLYTGLQVASDPGTNIVWLGCILLMLGLTVIYIAEYRVWVNVKTLNPQKKQYTIIIRCSRPNGIGVAQIINKLKHELNESTFLLDEVIACPSLS